MKNRRHTTNNQAFISLVRAGLWERDVLLSEYESIDFNAIYAFAAKQAVVGLVVAGLEHVVDQNLPKDIVLSMVGETLQLEERNKSLNAFIVELLTKLKEQGIFALLVKGQGVAQCYDRPLWRACGDVDLLMDPIIIIKQRNTYVL